MKNKDIYLVFSNTGTLLARCINFYTKDPYVHVSLSFDNSFKKMYSFGRVFPLIPFIGGLVEENLQDGVYKRFQNSRCVIYKISVDNNQYNLLKKELESFLKEQKKYKYSLLGLIGVALQKPIKRDNHYFCSEFISHLLIKSNIYDSDKIPGLTKPSDLLDINHKEFVYEGLAYEYHSKYPNLMY
ncbi:hypothetical protein PMY56_17815 [Clostridium tertium]|jgi:hypothetical protein|uniref:Permuted papain-like amidase enzyme, YaeF/YiiX, C92 family n=2 Tax=Clostridium tertium TaxID=1559 RepID=A0A9X3XLY3_9CLOT|nr:MULTISPECIES: hypothetical protein [Clostridium]MDU8966928.1 hypothetical protein [Clostridium sp.]EEH98508.1 hypothetical protein CSBG_02134 [Clostridium sp. 7_2_43FAA]MBU6137083.1 hypothetical protein [Clostridium tertium]MDB1923978.1 hypothetical protein [Clostridium tertium]MDB1927988.1 hypothetical protein [Clostridium tertium]